jgi:L-tyrosine isonitrile synthase
MASCKLNMANQRDVKDIFMENGGCFSSDLGTLDGKVAVPAFRQETFDSKAWSNMHDPMYECIGNNAKGDTLAAKLLSVLTNRKIRRGSNATLKLEDYCPQFQAQIQGYVDAGEPVKIVLPAFPFKFPNPLRTPNAVGGDLADVLALTQIEGMNQAVQQIYDPGMEFVVLHDSRVYSEIFGISEEGVQQFQAGLKKAADKLCTGIAFVDIVDDLVGNRLVWQSQVDECYESVSKQWAELKDTPHVQELLRNSRRNVNPACCVGSFSPTHGVSNPADFDHFFEVLYDNPEFENDPRRVCMDKYIEEFGRRYLAATAAVNHFNVIGESFPDHLRGTVHPKPGQLGIHLVNQKTRPVPWSGVGVIRCNGNTKRGFSTIRNWFDVVREPDRYTAIIANDYDGVFGYKELPK